MFESESDRVEHLAEDAFSDLDAVEPRVLGKATDPAPAVVALAAPHHGAAAILLDLSLALGTLMEVVAQQSISKPCLLMGLTTAIAMVRRLTLSAGLLAANADQRPSFLELAFVQHFVTVRAAAVDEVRIGSYSFGVGELDKLLVAVLVDNVAYLLHSWSDTASVLRADQSVSLVLFSDHRSVIAAEALTTEHMPAAEHFDVEVIVLWLELLVANATGEAE